MDARRPAPPAPYRDVDPPLPPERVPLARWRSTASLGGLLLACTIFMPALKACDQVIVPAHDLAQQLASAEPRASVAGLRGFAGTVVVYLAPYLFGALAAAAALGRHWRARWAGLFAWGAFAVGATVLSITLVAVSLRIGETWPWAIAVLSGGGYVASSLRLRHHAPLRATMALSGCCVLWFSFWSMTGDALYGVWLSAVAAVALLAGTIGEGRVVLGRRLYW